MCVHDAMTTWRPTVRSAVKSGSALRCALCTSCLPKEQVSGMK